MSQPWQIPLDCAPSFEKKTRAFEPSLLKHYMNLKLQDLPLDILQTGLMCDIDLQQYDALVIKQVIEAGMTIAKISIKQADLELGSHQVSCLREAVNEYSKELDRVYPLAVILDIDGPNIVTGNLRDSFVGPAELIPGYGFRLTTLPSWKNFGDIDCLYVEYDNLSDLRQGDMILMESLTNNSIQVLIEEVGIDSLECKVITGGQISSKMPVRIVKGNRDIREKKTINSVISASTSTFCSDIIVEGDYTSFHSQISWAVSADVDAIIVYKIDTLSDLKYVKNILGDEGKELLIIVSIDTEIAITNVVDILSLADGIFLDRSKLSVSVGVSKIFVAQKIIMAKCRDIGKPCICKIVINEELPAICVTDIANLVIDEAAAFFVQFECNAQLMEKFPNYSYVETAKKCLAAVTIISRYAEKINWQPSIYNKSDLMHQNIGDQSLALCMSAVEMAMSVKAVAIICLTQTGRTAKILTFVKPPCHIIAVTKVCRVARQLRLWRGLKILHYIENEENASNFNIEEQTYSALQYCKEKRILQAGDPYVVISSSQKVGQIDSIRLLYASAKHTISLN